jgi:hypothetical protein
MLGLVICGYGLILGLSSGDVKTELKLMVAGAVLFVIGRLILGGGAAE